MLNNRLKQETIHVCGNLYSAENQIAQKIIVCLHQLYFKVYANNAVFSHTDVYTSL